MEDGKSMDFVVCKGCVLNFEMCVFVDLQDNARTPDKEIQGVAQNSAATKTCCPTERKCFMTTTENYTMV